MPMPESFEPVAGFVHPRDIGDMGSANVLVYTDGQYDQDTRFLPCLIVPASPTPAMVTRANDKLLRIWQARPEIGKTDWLSDEEMAEFLTAALAPEGA